MKTGYSNMQMNSYTYLRIQYNSFYYIKKDLKLTIKNGYNNM